MHLDFYRTSTKNYSRETLTNATMNWTILTGLIQLFLGLCFIILAFIKQWRDLIAPLNPYSSKLMVSIISIGIGLLETYAGLKQLNLL
jgi:hypothetical protein